MNQLKSKKGFTLVELIVVIGILLVLTVLAAVAFSGLSAQAQQAARRSDARTVAQSLNIYNSLVANNADRIQALPPAAHAGRVVANTGTFNLEVQVAPAAADGIIRPGIIDMDVSVIVSPARYLEITTVHATEPHIIFQGGRWIVVN